MATLLALEGQLKRYVERQKRRANNVKKAVVRTILKDLTEFTPVDTSQAISNWQVGINNPVNATRGPIVPGKHGSTYVPSSYQAYVFGNSVLQLVDFGESVFVSNNLDYIQDLEGPPGKSLQNAGFVVDAVVKGRITLARLNR